MKDRVVVFGAVTRGKNGGYDPFAARVGDVSQSLENELTCLKGAELKKALWGDTINNQTVIEAVDRLNKFYEEKYANTVRTVTLFSADPDHPASQCKQEYRIFSTHKSLALDHINQEVKALVYDRDELPVLNEEQMTRVVDFAAMFVDLDPLIAKAGKKTRKTLSKIQERADVMIRELAPHSRI